MEKSRERISVSRMLTFSISGVPASSTDYQLWQFPVLEKGSCAQPDMSFTQ